MKLTSIKVTIKAISGFLGWLFYFVGLVKTKKLLAELLYYSLAEIQTPDCGF